MALIVGASAPALTKKRERRMDMDLRTKFKKIFVSYELGLRKPDEEAFYAVAEAIGEPIHQILFFDDSPENVAIASRLGMQIVEVKTVQDVKERLELLL